METIKLQGEMGKITFSPSKVSRRLIKRIEKELKRLISTPENYMNADEMRAILKKKDPLIGTPGGTLKAYRTRAELTQLMLSKKSAIKQSHLSEMECNKRPIGVKVAKKLAQVLKCDYRRLL